jgi:hypothetical protein
MSRSRPFWARGSQVRSQILMRALALVICGVALGLAVSTRGALAQGWQLLATNQVDFHEDVTTFTLPQRGRIGQLRLQIFKRPMHVSSLTVHFADRRVESFDLGFNIAAGERGPVLDLAARLAKSLAGSYERSDRSSREGRRGREAPVTQVDVYYRPRPNGSTQARLELWGAP